MRRVLLAAVFAAAAAFAPATASAACVGESLCALDGCFGTVSVCPFADACTGLVNVCPAAHREDCHGSVDVCAVPCVEYACFSTDAR